MPIINFTKADALQTRKIEPGIYTSEITQIEGPKKSSTGKSFNFLVTFTITVDGPYKGKEILVIVNTESTGTSVLGTAQFFPKRALLEIEAAINGKDVAIEDHPVDTDTLLHAPLDVGYGVQIVEGVPINIITGFFAAGYGKSAPAF